MSGARHEIGDRVAWYRYDDHLSEAQRYGTVVGRDDDGELVSVAWDDHRDSTVFASYLESEAEVRAWFAAGAVDE